MSNHKIYTQQGLSSDVQFGKGGGRLVFTNGVFTFVATPTGDTLSRLKIATAQDDDDAVTLGEMNEQVNHVYAKLDRTSVATEAKIDSMSNALLSIRLDAIESTDNSYGMLADANGLHLTDAKTDFGTLVNANGALILSAVSSGNADIRLVPAGQGSVIIGDGSEDGVIQPEGGHSLTIAGGDADAAGSVIIRGGHGTTPGHVEIHDLLDPKLPQDAVTLTALRTATGDLSAQIATQVGTLQTTMANNASVANAGITSLQGAVASVEQSIAAYASGSLRACTGTFSEVAGDTPVVAIPAGTLLRLKVRIMTAFSAGSTITVKTSASTLAQPTVIDETQPGIYSVELLETTLADEITVSITTTGNGGTASLALEYVAA